MHIYIYIYTYTYVYIYMYICIHTFLQHNKNIKGQVKGQVARRISTSLPLLANTYFSSSRYQSLDSCVQKKKCILIYMDICDHICTHRVRLLKGRVKGQVARLVCMTKKTMYTYILYTYIHICVHVYIYICIYICIYIYT